MTNRILFVLAALWLVVSATVASAQAASFSFGSPDQDTDEPVEVTSDRLAIDEETGTALFTGDVVIGQGEMRMTAPRVLVIYKEDESGIDRLEATGGVTIVSAEDAAESQRADYFVDQAEIHMFDDVLMTQGRNIISSDKAVINRDDGTALMTGRVKTILQPNEDN